MKKLKVVHICGSSPQSGAGRAVVLLHNALRNNDEICSYAIFENGVAKSENVYILNNNKRKRNTHKLKKRVESKITSIFYPNINESFTLGLFGSKVLELDLIEKADIIHLHWINGAMLSLNNISKIKKPVIWTIRDMWAFTGGCHYDHYCNKYIDKCQKCPVLGSKYRRDLSFYLQAKKKESFNQLKNLKLVGISSWITDCLNESDIFKERKAIKIANCINIESFTAKNKSEAKNELGITAQKKIILTGALSLNRPYKGFSKFLECLHYLSREDYLIAFFGKMNDFPKELQGFEIKNFGFINNDSMLNSIYACADVFVMPSIQEAFGKTVVESVLSGTPVVCFNSSGPKELISHKISGYKANPFQSEDLAEGINWVVNNLSHISEEERENLKNKYSPNTAALKYQKIYKKMIG